MIRSIILAAALANPLCLPALADLTCTTGVGCYPSDHPPPACEERGLVMTSRVLFTARGHPDTPLVQGLVIQILVVRTHHSAF